MTGIKAQIRSRSFIEEILPGGSRDCCQPGKSSTRAPVDASETSEAIGGKSLIMS
jgi:hypothetical protein